MNTINIINKINDLLKNKNLTVGKVEKLANIGNGSVRNFLNGKTKRLSLSTLNALAIVFNCSLKDLTEEQIEIDSVLPWNYELYSEVINFIENFLISNLIVLTFDNINELARSIYIYCYKKGTSKIDVDFSEWYLKDRLKLEIK